ARCAWTRSNGHSRYRRSTAGASARDHAAGSSAYNVVAGPAAYRGRITWTPFTTSRLGMWRKRVYCRSGRTDGSGGQYGTGETTRTSHRSFSARVGRSVQSRASAAPHSDTSARPRAHEATSSYANAGVFGDDFREPRCERVLRERVERVRGEERTRGLAVSGDRSRRQPVEVCPQLAVVGEVAHVDVAVPRNPLLDVRGADVDRDGSGVEAIEDLLGDPPFEDHVLEADGERVPAERRRLRRHCAPPGLSRRDPQRVSVGNERPPAAFGEVRDPTGVRRHARGPEAERRTVPADPVQIDLVVPREELDCAHALAEERVRREARQLVGVDDRHERTLALRPDRLVDMVERLREPERLELDGLREKRTE